MVTCSDPGGALNNNMWKSVGSVSNNDKTERRSREEALPFGEASRLRMNESQLSRELSPQFMGNYFEKKRSPEPNIHRVRSHKQLEYMQVNSPSSSRDTPMHRGGRDLEAAGKEPKQMQQNQVRSNGVISSYGLNEAVPANKR